MDYYELRKDEVWIKPLIDIEYRLRIKFARDLISHKIYYTQDRYLVFALNIPEYLFKKSIYGQYYIDDVATCNKRNQIGNLLIRFPFTFLIVYHTCNHRFRFYMNLKKKIIKLTDVQIEKFDIMTAKEKKIDQIFVAFIFLFIFLLFLSLGISMAMNLNLLPILFLIPFLMSVIASEIWEFRLKIKLKGRATRPNK